MERVLSINMITSNPNVRGGCPCIAGTTLRVSDIAMATVLHRQTLDEIASAYDISLAQVYAALAYYYDHKPELDQDIRQQIAKARELKEKRVGSRHL